MIRILVQGTPLVLYRNTTMTVELNNALFVSPDIEGDISFSFTIPVEGNEMVLGFAHKTQIESEKRLQCQVYCNGGFSWNGDLVIQKSGRDSLTAALIINPYLRGFGNRKLTNNYDTEIAISQSLETHSIGWEQFLTASVNDQDVKFAPFFNTDGYGSANDNWGVWHGNSRRKIVNALFFTPAGELIDSDGFPFSKAHCEMFTLPGAEDIAPAYEMNQLAFCPQVRIARVMDLWCRNAGYKFINHLGDDLNGTFLQSQKSLDGTAAQYEDLSSFIIDAEAHVVLSSQYNRYYQLNSDDLQHVLDGMLFIPAAGWWRFEVAIQYRYGAKETLANFQIFGENENVSETGLYVFQGVMITENIGGNVYMASGEFEVYIPVGYTSVPLKVLCTHQDESPIHFIDWTTNTYMEGAQLSLTVSSSGGDQTPAGFNIFRSRFRIPEVLPDVSNASFLKTMMETMGLCYFVSGKLRIIELVPYAMLKHAASLDLTAYELTRETETDNQEETMRTFRLAPLMDEAYNEDLRLPDIEMELPNAYSNHEHLILRTKTNTLYRATKLENETTIWTEHWEEHSGNPDLLEVGNGKEEKREPGVKIPHQRPWANKRPHPDIDVMTNEVPQLMVADMTISSDLYNPGDTPSDIILTQYRGFRERTYEGAGHVKNEVMLPVWNNEFALTAKGENSLGEKYVKPVLDLLSHKIVTYKFRLPTSMMQAVEDLLRPSELEPGMQTRFLVVRNVKTLPKKITIQIDNDIDDTVLCQIEAVKVY